MCTCLMGISQTIFVGVRSQVILVMNLVNPHMPNGSKTTDYFGDISLTKVIFRKYLKEKC